MKTVNIQKSDLTEYAIELGVWEALLESIGLDVDAITATDDDSVELLVHSGTLNQ